MAEERTDAQGGRVTLHAIAAEAGVSVSTVSKVLNDRADVSVDTKERVEAVVEALGYRRRPARRRGSVVDLVLNELDSLWSVEIVRGVDEVLHAAGASMVLSAVHGRSADTREWIDQLAARRSSGAILVVSDLTPQQRRRLAALDVPFVLVDPVGHVDALVPTVGATNWAGAVSATDHLIDLGHTRIAHLAGPRQLLCSRARADGYRATMERAELPVPAGFVPHGDFNDTSGRRATARLLDDLAAAGEEPPTAVFAASDLQALGAFEELRARGLRIPEDVSIVGFDDLPVARWTHPALTTVRQPLFDMAAMAANTLLRIIDGEHVENLRVELATRLVVRASTAPPAPADGGRPAPGTTEERSAANPSVCPGQAAEIDSTGLVTARQSGRP
ncbi:LacI family DNA-binding transcriptional regulator [Streptomyces sp. NPDC001919]